MWSAASALRPATIKERIEPGDLGLSKIDAQRHRAKRAAGVHRVGGRLEMIIHLTQVRVGDTAQHSLDGRIMRLEFSLPVHPQMTPGRIREEGGLGFDEHGRIYQAAAADADAGHDAHMPKDRLREKALPAERRQPEEMSQAFRRLLHVCGTDTPSLFQHRYVVAFFGQAQRRDRAAKAAAHDDSVIVHRHAPVRARGKVGQAGASTGVSSGTCPAG